MKYYSIKVAGAEPSVVEEGTINKTTGTPDGRTVKLTLLPGATFIPNFSRVWAKKIIEKNAYAGKLEFLPWGTKGGEVVQIRFLQGRSSLDKEYQETVLKIKLNDEEVNEYSQIELTSDINDFDESSADPMFIEMIKHHTYNGSNTSRDPQNKSIKFFNYNPSDLNKNRLEILTQKKAAMDIILDAQDDEGKLFVLATIFNLDPQSQNEVIFNGLLNIIGENEEDYAQILTVTNEIRLRFRARLDELVSLKKIEIFQGEDESAVYEIFDGNREMLIDNISPEIKDVKQYLTNNVLEPGIFKVYERLQEINERVLLALE